MLQDGISFIFHICWFILRITSRGLGHIDMHATCTAFKDDMAVADAKNQTDSSDTEPLRKNYKKFCKLSPTVMVGYILQPNLIFLRQKVLLWRTKHILILDKFIYLIPKQLAKLRLQIWSKRFYHNIEIETYNIHILVVCTLHRDISVRGHTSINNELLYSFLPRVWIIASRTLISPSLFEISSCLARNSSMCSWKTSTNNSQISKGYTPCNSIILPPTSNTLNLWIELGQEFSFTHW